VMPRRRALSVVQSAPAVPNARMATLASPMCPALSKGIAARLAIFVPIKRNSSSKRIPKCQDRVLLEHSSHVRMDIRASQHKRNILLGIVVKEMLFPFLVCIRVFFTSPLLNKLFYKKVHESGFSFQ
jgi:hypothetical protein